MSTYTISYIISFLSAVSVDLIRYNVYIIVLNAISFQFQIYEKSHRSQPLLINVCRVAPSRGHVVNQFNQHTKPLANGVLSTLAPKTDYVAKKGIGQQQISHLGSYYDQYIHIRCKFYWLYLRKLWGWCKTIGYTSQTSKRQLVLFAIYSPATM